MKPSGGESAPVAIHFVLGNSLQAKVSIRLELDNFCPPKVFMGQRVSHVPNIISHFDGTTN